MGTSLEPRVLSACVRGCVREAKEGEPAALMAAVHGPFCNRCYSRAETALGMAPSIVGHLVSLTRGLRSRYVDGSQRTRKEPPLPMNVEAFQDGNLLYSRLAYWAGLFAGRLALRGATPAARTWRTEGGEVVGLPANLEPAEARQAAFSLGRWLVAHLEDICRLPDTDDVVFFQEELVTVYRLNAKWPREDRSTYAKVRCWAPVDRGECKERVVLTPPRRPGEEQAVACEGGHRFEFDEFDRMSSVFREVRKHQAQELNKVARRMAHLSRKYGQSAGIG